MGGLCPSPSRRAPEIKAKTQPLAAQQRRPFPAPGPSSAPPRETGEKSGGSQPPAQGSWVGSAVTPWPCPPGTPHPGQPLSQAPAFSGGSDLPSVPPSSQRPSLGPCRPVETMAILTPSSTIALTTGPARELSGSPAAQRLVSVPPQWCVPSQVLTLRAESPSRLGQPSPCPTGTWTRSAWMWGWMGHFLSCPSSPPPPQPTRIPHMQAHTRAHTARAHVCSGPGFTPQ